MTIQPEPVEACGVSGAVGAGGVPSARVGDEAVCRRCGHPNGQHYTDEPRACKKRCRCVSFAGPVEPVADTEAVEAADMRGNLTKMVADVIAMHPCYRDVDGHQGADCPQARAVIESLSRPPALRALVELAPDHPRKPVLPEPRPVAEKSSNEFRNVVLDRAAVIACGTSS